MLVWDGNEESFKKVTDFTQPGNSNGSANSGLFGVAASSGKFTYTGNEERMSAQVVCF